MTHHPRWKEVRTEYLSDPEVMQWFEQYAPVFRDRSTERARCEEMIPGYREARGSE